MQPDFPIHSWATIGMDINEQDQCKYLLVVDYYSSIPDTSATTVYEQFTQVLTAYVLCFDLLTRPKMPFKVMHRKEVTHSNGSYERKSRGQKLADEMGRDKKIPLYSHRLTHRKRVTSELHDSYFHSMTITQAIPKIAEVTHPDR